MRYTTLGAPGVTVSRICLDCMSYGSRSWRPWVLEEDEARPFFRRAVEAVAAERGATPAEIALAGLPGRPVVTPPIVGATKLAHLDAPYRPHPVRGHR